MGMNMLLDNELRQWRAILADPKRSSEDKARAQREIGRVLSFYDENA
jgi:hypothetical protein